MDYKYNCDHCELKYKSLFGLKKHIKTKHPNNNEKKQKSYTCEYCGNIFKHRQSKWVHEKTCKESNKIPLAEQVKMLTEKVNKLENKKPENFVTNNNSNNNITNNNNTQNVICVFPLGNEPANALSIDYIKKTLNEHGINSVLEIVKKKHFNPELPECQNFCVTALNNNYACVVDQETKSIKSVNKKDVFDKVYVGVVSHINQIDQPDEKEKETIDKINSIPVSKKMFKKLQCGINEEAYHNRGLVKKTWKTAQIAEPVPDPKPKPVQERKTQIDLNDVSDDSDCESNCESDTPSLLSESSDDSSGQLKSTKVKPQAQPPARVQLKPCPIAIQEIKPKIIGQDKSDKPMDKIQVISQLQQLRDEINKTNISKA